MEYKVKILATRFITHNVKQFILERPEGYSFIPGNYTDVCVNKGEWIKEKRPFTFTCLSEDKVLEFNIKRYPEDKSVTDELHKLKVGDELILEDPTGTIQYNGPGVFIAGGAGITPFIAILRDLYSKGKIEGNSLIFSNKTHKDIIHEREFLEMLGQNCIFLLTREEKEGYLNARIDEKFLKDNVKNFEQHFYVCGPTKFVGEISSILKNLGANPDSIVVES